MTIEIQRGFRYNLQTFAGDSGSLYIENIPTDLDTYVIYIEIKGKTTLEKSVVLNGESSCTFDFTPEETEALGVGNWEYGIKLCDSVSGEENTLVPDLSQNAKAFFTVYPKRVEGIINE